MLQINYFKIILCWAYCIVAFKCSIVYAFELKKNINFPQKQASICFNNGLPSFKNIVHIDYNSFTFITEKLPAFKGGKQNNPTIKLTTLSKELIVLNETERTIDYMMENSYDNPFIDVSKSIDSNCYALFNLNRDSKQIYRISLRAKSIDAIKLSDTAIAAYFYGIEIDNNSGFYLYGNSGANFLIANYDNTGRNLFTNKYNARNQIRKIYGICFIKNRIYCALDVTKDNDDIFKICVCKNGEIIDELAFEGKQASLYPYRNNSILCVYKHSDQLEFIVLNEKNTISETFKKENAKGLLDYKIEKFDEKIYLFMLYNGRIDIYERLEKNFRLIGTQDLYGFFSTIGFAIIDANTCFIGLSYPVFIAKTKSAQHEIAILKFER